MWAHAHIHLLPHVHYHYTHHLLKTHTHQWLKCETEMSNMTRGSKDCVCRHTLEYVCRHVLENMSADIFYGVHSVRWRLQTFALCFAPKDGLTHTDDLQVKVKMPNITGGRTSLKLHPMKGIVPMAKNVSSKTVSCARVCIILSFGCACVLGKRCVCVCVQMCVHISVTHGNSTGILKICLKVMGYMWKCISDKFTYAGKTVKYAHMQRQRTCMHICAHMHMQRRVSSYAPWYPSLRNERYKQR